MKKAALLLAAILMLMHPAAAACLVTGEAYWVGAAAASVMEAESGEVLFAQEIHRQLPMASTTKIMTALLTLEAVDQGGLTLDQQVAAPSLVNDMDPTGSSADIKEGEVLTVEQLLYCMMLVSANEAACILAETVAGSQDAFVALMNQRAQELGCTNTHFINCNGLDETSDHYSSARDVARISQELLRHEKIFDYTTIWMDSLRNGQFGLSNTNKLVRFYKGANGLKTGSTSTAKYCLSATAERDGMQLIAVVLCAPSTAERFSSATALLDYGFANYAVVDSGKLGLQLPEVQVLGGTAKGVQPEVHNVSFNVKKGNQDRVEKEVQKEPSVKAPVASVLKLGEAVFRIDGEEFARK